MRSWHPNEISDGEAYFLPENLWVNWKKAKKELLLAPYRGPDRHRHKSWAREQIRKHEKKRAAVNP